MNHIMATHVTDKPMPTIKAVNITEASVHHFNSRQQALKRAPLALITLIISCLLLAIIGNPVKAATYPAPGKELQHLKILSSTDESVMKILIADYQTRHPNISIEYEESSSLTLFANFRANYQQGRTADLIISSAMDLQIKLVNDGHAATHISKQPDTLPAWSQWRNQAFGFTYEPAVMVYNKTLLTGEDIPTDRFELIELLRKPVERFKGRIGTYDIEESGFGYLLASQDAQQASTWGRLTENLNNADVKLYDSTRGMLDALESGELLLGYNVLGSYAYAAIEASDQLAMILPSDYTLVMSRVAFVSKKAGNPEAGHQFLDYLMSLQGQQLLARKARLYPIHPQVSGEATYSGLQAATRNRGLLRLIKLGPALLTYQDQMKKANFLNEWKKVSH